jgi:hypothetical protein
MLSAAGRCAAAPVGRQPVQRHTVSSLDQSSVIEIFDALQLRQLGDLEGDAARFVLGQSAQGHAP